MGRPFADILSYATAQAWSEKTAIINEALRSDLERTYGDQVEQILVDAGDLATDLYGRLLAVATVGGRDLDYEVAQIADESVEDKMEAVKRLRDGLAYICLGDGMRTELLQSPILVSTKPHITHDGKAGWWMGLRVSWQ